MILVYKQTSYLGGVRDSILHRPSHNFIILLGTKIKLHRCACYESRELVFLYTCYEKVQIVLSHVYSLHSITTETRCNIGKAPHSFSTESKADQLSDLVWNDALSLLTKSHSLSSSTMLFPVINFSSRLTTQRIAIVSNVSNTKFQKFERPDRVNREARTQPCQPHRPKDYKSVKFIMDK